MNKGWISIQRKIFDNIILKPKGKYTRMEAFLWLIKETSYSDQEVNIGNEIYKVKSGQILRSQEKLRKQFKWGNTKLRNFLKLLEKVGTIKVETNSKLTMITMLKFNDFQKRQTENKYQTNIKQIHSNKGNKINKDIYTRIDEFKKQCEELLPTEHDEYENFINYYTEYNDGGKKFKKEFYKTFNIKMRWNTWLKNDFGSNNKQSNKNLDNKFPFDKTGNSRLGYCNNPECKDPTIFLDKINPSLDSTCCSGFKVITKQERNELVKENK